MKISSSFIQLVAAVSVAVLLPYSAFAMDDNLLVPKGEAPEIRQKLENGWSAEHSRSQRLAEAFSNYRKAAIYGSSEGYYRAAKMQLSNRKNANSQKNGMCLLQVASQLGHLKAADQLVKLMQRGISQTRCNDSAFTLAIFDKAIEVAH